MQNTTEKSSRSAEGLYKFFIYFVLVLLAVTIIVPVAWVFMASIKQNAEFYGNPWALPAGFYWQNFVNAWNGAKMGEYMLNSVIVTALALALLLVVALPAAYCLSRFHFKGRKVLNTLYSAQRYSRSLCRSLSMHCRSTTSSLLQRLPPTLPVSMA